MRLLRSVSDRDGGGDGVAAMTAQHDFSFRQSTRPEPRRRRDVTGFEDGKSWRSSTTRTGVHAEKNFQPGGL
jgi:hypothetical protein